MAKSTYEIQLTDRVKQCTSDSNEVTRALLIEFAQRAAIAILSIPSSTEPVYFGGNIYELKADREAMFRAQARQK